MKRALDIAAALGGLLALWPLLVVTMMLVRLTSRGPAVFTQDRIGKNGRTFTLYKLRTMHVGTEHAPTHTIGASAITPLGRLMRKSKLDELPQLLNVLRGDMSLVGPRPCLPSQTELIEARRRLGVLELPPGITGLAQIRGIDMSNPALLAATDAEYARTRSVRRDLWIIAKTLTGFGMGADRTRGSTSKPGTDPTGRKLNLE